MKPTRALRWLALALFLAFPFSSREMRAQTGEATISINVGGGNADVSLFVARTGGTAWRLGTSSFVLHFNSAAMTFSSIVANGVWSGGNYSTSFSAPYNSGGARSMEIEFNGSAGQGTDVPTIPTLLGTLRFTILNPNANHGITWAHMPPLAACFVANDAGNDVTAGITFTDPLTGVKETESPTVFSLSQNYPNPWNPSTTIGYGLPHNTFVTLTVFNTLGQQVAQLVNEQQQAGYHDVVLRGDGLASGVYFYRIQAGDFVSSKKLLLLK